MARSTELERKEAQLEALYRRAEQRLTDQLADDIEKGNLGSAKYRRARIESVRRVLSDLQDEAVPEATDLATMAYQEGARQAATATASPVASFGSGQHLQAMELLADNMVSGLNGAAEAVGRRVEDAYRKAGLEAAAQQISEGGTLRDATKSLIDLLRSQGLDAGPGGAQTWKLSRYAEMVIRTNTTEAITRGNINQATGDGYDLVEVLAIGDEALCETCSAFVGTIYTLGERSGYDTLTEFPPFHPNCRCDLNILTKDPNA